jgi:3-oxoacyl-[acyl-carrier-protein] synthase I
MAALGLPALGIATSIGAGKAAVAAALRDSLRPGLEWRTGLIEGAPALVGAVNAPLPPIGSNHAAYDSRNNRLALLALSEIIGAIEELIARFGRKRIAVVMGSSTSGISDAEAALATRKSDGRWPARFSYLQQEPGSLSEFIARFLGIEGPAYTIATACSSSGKAFASGRRLIEAGVVDAAIVGGCDTLCRLTLNGFWSLEALTRTACNPFSRNRDGIAIGEGAAVFVMTPDTAPVMLLGAGESSDAYHASAPHPDGIGALACMRAALTDAELDPGDIDYINLHGTGTPQNDRVESHAVYDIFGDTVPCSSTKPMIGHTLGAASACEAAFLWLTLSQGEGAKLPPHLWDGERDPELAPIALVEPGAAPSDRAPRAMLSTSFAFGGSNVALILGRA